MVSLRRFVRTSRQAATINSNSKIINAKITRLVATKKGLEFNKLLVSLDITVVELTLGQDGCDVIPSISRVCASSSGGG